MGYRIFVSARVPAPLPWNARKAALVRKEGIRLLARRADPSRGIYTRAERAQLRKGNKTAHREFDSDLSRYQY